MRAGVVVENAGVGACGGDGSARVASEIAAACRVSDRAVQRDVDEAMTLVESFPKVVAAWEAGAVSRRHVRVIAEVGMQLPAEKRVEFDALAAALAGEVSSPGRLKSRLTIASEALQPRTITERHRAAREGRCVRIVPGVEGMSDLIATLPTVLAEAVFDRLTQQARVIVDARPDEAATARAMTPRSPASWGPVGSSGSAKAPDTRSVDQVRADVFADMLLTADPAIDPTRIGDGPGTLGRIRARVQVVVPALTVLDPAREATSPAELVGRGPIDTALARDLADATSVPWDRVITHPVSGAVLHTDTYARTAAIDRHLRARDRHCRWPGCITPAIRSEVDHTLDHHLGGATRVSNLAHLCQRHHTQKQFTRWTVRQGDAGVLEWTSPTGRTYTHTPDPYPPATPSPGVRFEYDTPPWEMQDEQDGTESAS
nr:HNH endonuclease signature motif containing protein [Microbacterium proteolyticum]